ncbi:LLM class flavin-dependent oxidoreductase [Rhodococcus hoagii]|nr:LLM class flavin-dependent oxidoreductase [Prescottella equi]
MSARTPTKCAMHSPHPRPPLRRPGDPRSGCVGPQVVEGWYGQPSRSRSPAPVSTFRSCARSSHARLRCGRRTALPVALHRFRLDGSGQAAQADHAPAARGPAIWLGAEGPKNVALTAEIADGWLAIYYTRGWRRCTTNGSTRGSRAPGHVGAGGFRDRSHVPGGRHRRPAGRDRQASADHRAVCRRYGCGRDELPCPGLHPNGLRRRGQGIQKLFLSGRKAEAAAIVPTRWSPTR